MTYLLYIPNPSSLAEKIVRMAETALQTKEFLRFGNAEELNSYLKAPRGEKSIVLLLLDDVDQVYRLELNQWWRVHIYAVIDSEDEKLLDAVAHLSPRFTFGTSQHQLNALKEVLHSYTSYRNSSESKHSRKVHAVNPKQGA